jgi:hypothetical protein
VANKPIFDPTVHITYAAKTRHMDYESQLDKQYGKGKWHCDDLWAAKTLPACVQTYLDVARAPATEKLKIKEPPALFATYKNKRVRVVMASRFGDVGITTFLKAVSGYEYRVLLPELTDFSDKP